MFTSKPCGHVTFTDMQRAPIKVQKWRSDGWLPASSGAAPEKGRPGAAGMAERPTCAANGQHVPRQEGSAPPASSESKTRARQGGWPRCECLRPRTRRWSPWKRLLWDSGRIPSRKPLKDSCDVYSRRCWNFLLPSLTGEFTACFMPH